MNFKAYIADLVLGFFFFRFAKRSESYPLCPGAGKPGD
jgi:hypothetical protein